MAKSKKQSNDNRIARNRKAAYDYFIEERFEAGLSLMGWEVKSLRAGRIQLDESYVVIKKDEAWLFGAHITPLSSASTHVETDPSRSRKLLLHRKEIDRLSGYRDREGYTIVPLSLCWKKENVKCELGLAKGKKQHDKRSTTKEREWNIQKQRILRNH